MKKVLCLCNTYFQLAVLIQMRKNLLKEHRVDLLLSDHSVNASIVADRLRHENVFDSVTLACTKEDDTKQKGILQEMGSALLVGTAQVPPWVMRFKDEKYDEFLFFNVGVSTLALYYTLKKSAPDLVCAIYEEGIFNYSAPQLLLQNYKLPGRVRLAEKMNVLRGRKSILQDVQAFYCMYPQLYQGPLPICQIPACDAADIQTILKSVFFTDDAKTEYPQKYIYLSSICDFEGGASIHELELVKHIAMLVGEDELLIKVHPRDDPERFRREGLTVAENSVVPWEVIQMGLDEKRHVLLTATSASILSGSLMTHKAVKAAFLHPLCDCEENKLAQRSISSLMSVLEKMGDVPELKNVHICTDVKQIVSI